MATLNNWQLTPPSTLAMGQHLHTWRQQISWKNAGQIIWLTPNICPQVICPILRMVGPTLLEADKRLRPAPICLSFPFYLQCLMQTTSDGTSLPHELIQLDSYLTSHIVISWELSSTQSNDAISCIPLQRKRSKKIKISKKCYNCLLIMPFVREQTSCSEAAWVI